MDLNDLRVIVTVASMALFVAICFWAWSRRNLAAFDEAAQLPLREDDITSRDASGRSA